MTRASCGSPLRTPDGRYIIVRGRLWRATNPSLSAREREYWTRALMKARRERARHAVDRAKIALGERGPVWWTDGSPDYNRRLVRNTPYADWLERVERSEDAIVNMLAERETSLCPSEVARRIDPRHWRAWMENVRTAAWSLAQQGRAVITQRGVARDDPGSVKGPIRIGRPSGGRS